MMDSELLEKLLLDRALGEMRADVAALLEAYLEREPAARRTAEEWAWMADMAQRSMGDDDQPLPAFPWRRLAAAQRVRWMARGAVMAAGIAACIAVGWVIGSQMSSRPGTIVQVAAMPAGKSEAKEADLHDESARGFWSVAQLRARMMASASRPENAVPVWTVADLRRRLGE